MSEQADPASRTSAERADHDDLEAELRRRFAPAEAEAVIVFARGLFARDGERYAAELGEEDRAALVASAFGFFAMAPAPVRCRLRTPTAAQGGWDSPYTIFESHLSDRPFIVDTIRELFHRRGISVRHLLHPIYSVERDRAGSLVRMRSPEGRQESFVHCAIDRVTDAELPGLERELAARLGDVFVATEDYRRMRDRLEELRDEIDPQATTAADADEIDEFLGWLGAGHFVFLGYGGYRRAGDGDTPSLQLDTAYALGMLRIPERAQEIAARDLDPASRAPVDPQARFAVIRSAVAATVHRAARMDVVVVRRSADPGRPAYEHRFYGLFTDRFSPESRPCPTLTTIARSNRSSRRCRRPSSSC